MHLRTEHIEQTLRSLATPAKQAFLPRFFKTGIGEYGEGDRFLGVVVPDTRRVAKQYKEEVSVTMLEDLLQSEWHECRLCALLILVERFRKASSQERKAIYDFYLSHTDRINNWDLVDLSAPGVVGQYLLDRPRSDLDRLAASANLWEQRIAVVSTYTLIKQGDCADTLRLAVRFVVDPPALNGKPAGRPLHDLMQKAVGWMLREVGKQDRDALIGFLETYAACMPRTMLRYAIEKFSAEERAYWRALK